MPRYEVTIDVRINGREFPMDSLDDWRKFQQYLDRQIDFFSLAPPGWPDETETHPQQDSPSETVMEPAPRARLSIPHPPAGQRAIDLILGALETYGERAPIDKVIDTMLKNGWGTASPDQKSMRINVVATIRKYPGTVTQEGDILILTPAGKDFHRMPETRRASLQQEPVEKPQAITSAEWVVRAAKELSRPATGAEIYAKMVEMGFVSNAKKPIEAVKTIIRANPDFKRVGVTGAMEGLWEYKPSSTTATQDMESAE